VGLAREGCHVVVHGRDIDHLQPTLSLLRDHGVRAHAVAGDLSSETALRLLSKACDKGRACGYSLQQCGYSESLARHLEHYR
jgi:short-subunit dehydrogenase